MVIGRKVTTGISPRSVVIRIAVAAGPHNRVAEKPARSKKRCEPGAPALRLRPANDSPPP